VHFHLLVLDDVYVRGPEPAFRHVRPPSRAELDGILQDIAEAAEKQPV
jgi:hypothetical protein